VPLPFDTNTSSTLLPPDRNRTLPQIPSGGRRVVGRSGRWPITRNRAAICRLPDVQPWEATNGRFSIRRRQTPALSPTLAKLWWGGAAREAAGRRVTREPSQLNVDHKTACRLGWLSSRAANAWSRLWP